jgi:CMP-2-keto-3-deoxyoctulosonic acid synthetase
LEVRLVKEVVPFGIRHRLSDRGAGVLDDDAHVGHRLDHQALTPQPHLTAARDLALDARGQALYFSRAPIPVARDHGGQVWWREAQQRPTELLQRAGPLRHIGIYGYRARFLREFPKLSQAPLEVAEALEQLRAMWHGHKIVVHVSPLSPGPGIDTPQDLERVRKMFAH